MFDREEARALVLLQKCPPFHDPPLQLQALGCCSRQTVLVWQGCGSRALSLGDVLGLETSILDLGLGLDALSLSVGF